MASILGFDNSAIIFFLIAAVYGVPILIAGILDFWYVILVIFGLMILAALGIVISNPGEYLSIPTEY